jgi:hypothetical protein
MNLLLVFIFPFLVAAEQGQAQALKKAEEKAAKNQQALNVYFEEWKAAGKKKCSEPEYRSWEKQCIEFYDTSKTINGGIFISSDNKLDIQWKNIRDCVSHTVYKLNGKIIRITYEYYDTQLDFHYDNNKLILFIDNETVAGACSNAGNYYARFYFNNNKEVGRFVTGSIKEERKRERNGERYELNVFTDAKQITELADQLLSSSYKE